MPTIEITEDQYEYLQALQEDIQTQVVGKYAHVRTVDAVQYLIDNHEGEINATATEPADGPASSGAVAAPDADDGSGDASDGDADEAADGGEVATESADGGARDADGAGDDAAAAAPVTPGGGGDDGMLSAMMALMDTHDDKWEEASGDTGYQVELPDGSTESANTQDDVRALLFKHYE